MSTPALADGVTVLVPAFNAAAHVAAALASALAPSAVPVEVVVADDASTDETVAVVEGIAREDARVRLVRMDRKGGPSRARNAAAAGARYGWLAMLDADDEWAPGRLERLAGVAERTGAEVVSDDIEVCGLRGERWRLGRAVGWTPTLDAPLDALEFARRGWPVKPVFTRLLFDESGGFDEDVAYGEDALLFTEWL
ncbi:MAG TPA: glycosyltransferase family 2 protein, partial [Rubricoccaceae bacterium]